MGFSHEEEMAPIYQPRLKSLLRQVSCNAEKRVQASIKESTLFRSGKKYAPPGYEMSELSFGSPLGHGEFCIVQEVLFIHGKDFSKKDEVHQKNEIFPVTMDSDSELDLKRSMVYNASRKKKSSEKYAIKYLNPDIVLNPSLFERGLVDLTYETLMLSAVSHPNIIKIRGYSKNCLFQPNFFILLDRLQCTLDMKLEEWKASKRSKRFTKNILFKENTRSVKAIPNEKLNILESLSSAMFYLHCQKIVHRDLKPENIGFDLKGDVKIFDFGLACELKPKCKTVGGLYNLTPNTGSRRYMAPEIARGEPYNHKVDVYSFAILMWEIMAMEKPFENFTVEMHDILIMQVGERPSIDLSWSKLIRDIITRSWAHDLRERLDSSELNTLMTKMNCGLK